MGRQTDRQTGNKKGGQSIILTPAGYEELKAEYEELVNVKRPAIVAAIDEARSLGDMSENEPYQEARRQQAQLEDRISELEEILKNAQIVEKSRGKGIGIGHTVVVEREDTRQEFTLVGEHEADIAKGKLSYTSPIGAALLGKKVGDEVVVDIPAGKATFRIVEVR